MKNFNLTLTFPNLTGKNINDKYENIISICSDMPGFMSAGKNSFAHMLRVSHLDFHENYQKFYFICRQASSLHSAKITLNEEPITIAELRNLETALECDKVSDETYKGCYCRNAKIGFGCKYLESVKLGLPKEKQPDKDFWFKFGSVAYPNRWIIDKDRMKSRLNQEARGKKLHFCSFYASDIMEKVVLELPGEISLNHKDFYINGNELFYKKDCKSVKLEEKSFYPKDIEVPHISKDENRTSDKIDEVLIEIEAGAVRQQDNIRNIPKTRYSDIGGIDEVIRQIREVVELPMKAPKLFSHLGIKPHKGILLYGPPGCGKTMLAKAIASETKAHFISVKASELLSKWHGQSECNLRKLFEEAREKQPSIIYFDEIDSIGRARNDSEQGWLDSRFLATLLSLMDGIEDYGNVSVVASTNRFDLLDEALLRPGRFDLKIEIKKPDLQGCKKILSILTKEMPVAKEFDLDKFSEKLVGLSGAEIAFVAREAAFECLRKNIDLKAVLEEGKSEDIDYSRLHISEENFSKALSSLQAG